MRGKTGRLNEIVPKTMFLVESAIIYKDLAPLSHAKYSR